MIATASPQIEWRAVKNCDGVYAELYEVSDRGDVRSKTTGRMLRATASNRGYMHLNLLCGSPRRARLLTVHSLVAAAFIGPCPLGQQINHIDGNKRNNTLGNLEYCTQSHNIRHAFATGLMQGGAGHVGSKLTSDQVASIRARYESRGKRNSRDYVSCASLAAEFGVCEECIRRIVKGISYRIGSGRDYKRLLPAAGGVV